MTWIPTFLRPYTGACGRTHADLHDILILLGIIQKRILGSGLIHVDEESYWNTGLNGERIQNALNKWKVDTLPGDLYRFTDVDDPDLKLILDAFDIKISAKLYRRSELKSIKTDTKIFI